MKKILACLASLVLLSGCYTALETTSDEMSDAADRSVVILGEAPAPLPDPQPIIVLVPVFVTAPVQQQAPAPEPVRTIGSTRGTQEQSTASGGTSRDTGSHRRP